MEVNRPRQIKVSVSMWNLVVKVFFCYWIAAGIVIFAVDAFPHGHLPRQQAITALKSVLRFESRSVLTAYQNGGCAAALPMMASAGDQMFLASPNGNVLCGGAPSFSVQSLIADARKAKDPVVIEEHSSQLLAFAATAPSGEPYIVLLDCHISPYLWFWPGHATFAISGVVTLFLTMLIAVPIRRLSSAAQEISNGRLDARVPTGNFPKLLAWPIQSDIIQTLIANFNHMAERLQALVESQRTFLRDVSHELRSPLARLSIALELARETGNPASRGPLDRIEDEVRRAEDLIAQLLTLSQMEVLAEIAPAHAVSLGDLVAEMMPDIEFEANGRKCHVIATTSNDCFVHGDEFLLRRAFENVMRNAICYTPEGGTIEIAVEKLERNGGMRAVLRICDSGPGVHVDELQRILLPFYRVDKARQQSTGGFGVGLAIVDRVVKLHAGQIAAWNRPSGGLIVEMSFPLESTT